MAEIAEKVMTMIYGYLAEVKKHIPVEKVYLYGSYVTGKQDKLSDIDIAIFSDGFKNYSFVDSTTFLYSLARNHRDICIDPVAFTVSDMYDDNPFVKEILSKGKEISV